MFLFPLDVGLEYLWFFNNQELIWHAWTILNIPQILPRLKIFTTLTNSIKWIYFAVTSFHGRITSRDCRLQTEEIHQNFPFSFLKQFLRIFTSDVCYSNFCVSEFEQALNWRAGCFPKMWMRYSLAGFLWWRENSLTDYETDMSASVIIW